MTQLNFGFAFSAFAGSVVCAAVVFAIMPPLQSTRSSISAATEASDRGEDERSTRSRSNLCQALNTYPRGQKLSFETGEITGLCRPFVQKKRFELDRCGDIKKDPFSAASETTIKASTTTHFASKSFAPLGFTWPTRKEMYRRGHLNLLRHAKLKPERDRLFREIERVRQSMGRLCCVDNKPCLQAMENVDVVMCVPTGDSEQGDPCVFGGRFEMPGKEYSRFYESLWHYHSAKGNLDIRQRIESQLRRENRLTLMASLVTSGGTARAGAPTVPAEASALAVLATPLGRSLSIDSSRDRSSEENATEFQPRSGTIILTSYVPQDRGIEALIPTLHHEFGHACSMIRMQQMAAVTVDEPGGQKKAEQALQWFSGVHHRCDRNLVVTDAYDNFWESLGESRELASCLIKITKLNQENRIDRNCDGMCPGHYLEESAGIALSLLNGELSGVPGSVFPATCDHVRDAQHPLVADVVECLGEHSPRFRQRLREAQGCE